MIGAQGTPYLEEDHWQISLGYRYQFSHRHFVGTDEQEERAEQETEVENTIHLFDVGIAPEYLGVNGRDPEAPLGMLQLDPLDDGAQHEMVAEAPLRPEPEDIRIVPR